MTRQTRLRGRARASNPDEAVSERQRRPYCPPWYASCFGEEGAYDDEHIMDVMERLPVAPRDLLQDPVEAGPRVLRTPDRHGPASAGGQAA